MRDGVKLFIPGDVPNTDVLQKRTSSYAIQSLVLEVPENGKIYNSASLSVRVPSKEDNAKRAISIEKKETRKMESLNEGNLEYVYITDTTKNSTVLYNINNKETITIPKITSETTMLYFGNLNKFDSDITITLQGT